MNPVLLRGADGAASFFPKLVSANRNLCVHVPRPRQFHVTAPFLVFVLRDSPEAKCKAKKDKTPSRNKLAPSRWRQPFSRPFASEGNSHVTRSRSSYQP